MILITLLVHATSLFKLVTLTKYNLFLDIEQL